MEEFKNENSIEKEPNPIVLDKMKVMAMMWGNKIEDIVTDLIKVFSVIKYLNEKGVTTQKEIEETARDLFSEFDVAIFNYDSIFTKNVIDQVLGSNKLTSVSVEINETSITISSGATTESVMGQFKK